jgi:hypothetical protein
MGRPDGKKFAGREFFQTREYSLFPTTLTVLPLA